MNIAEITALQRERTAAWHQLAPTVAGTSLIELVERNHLENFRLWHEEDVARRDDVSTERIRDAKRAIDRHNQQRNDLIESIDRHLVDELQPPTAGCSFNSETPGMMIDRLSILALKEYHMREEVERDDATDKHRAACTKKLTIIRRQIADLSDALAELVNEVELGARSFRVYFQFKMYNDAELNPQLREAA